MDEILNLNVNTKVKEVEGTIDFNDFTTTGIYNIGTSADHKNSPASLPTAGILHVIADTKGKYLIQIFYDIHGVYYLSEVASYIRIKYNSDWYSWREGSSKNYVHKSGDETISGTKTFSSKIVGNLQGNADTATSANDPNAVHLEGDETITGTKTFIDTIISNLNFYNTTEVLDVEVPYVSIKERTNGLYQPSIVWKDKDSYELGNLRIGRSYSQDTTAILSANTFTTDGKYVSAEVQVVANSNSDGKSYAKAPTPSQSANSNEIVTAEWVNDLDENVVHKSGDESITGKKTFDSLYINSDRFTHVDPKTKVHWIHELPHWDGELLGATFVKGTNYWYRKHSDGFIEMGGFTNCVNVGGEVVSTNLPIAFSNTDYTLIVQVTRGTASGTSWGSDYSLPTTRSKTTTRFEVYSNGLGSPGDNGGYNWYACGY